VAIVSIFLIIVALVAGMVGCGGGGGDSFAGGSGTEGDPYQIANWNQLYNVRNYLDSYFILVNDLDSTTARYTERASSIANGGKGWEPIGNSSVLFNVNFDGQGYEIRNLFINRPDLEDGVGLFSFLGGGVIENVGVVDADVTGYGGVGILAGGTYGNVSNCYSTGSVSASGNGSVGGLMGGSGGNISDSYSTASVSGGDNVGGLVALVFGGTVDKCYSTGSVTGNLRVGGLLGYSEDTVNSSYATGSVSGYGGVGGLVGVNWDTVSNSYSTGSVAGNFSVGGLVGVNVQYGTVSNSYATGSVTGNFSVGGLVGENGPYCTVTNSFWDTETSGQATSDGGTGKTTAEMQDIITFSGAGWDIIAVDNSNDRNTGYVWNIVHTVTYPLLSWQPV